MVISVFFEITLCGISCSYCFTNLIGDSRGGVVVGGRRISFVTIRAQQLRHLFIFDVSMSTCSFILSVLNILSSLLSRSNCEQNVSIIE